ncbi:MAG: hypothetical protein QOD90_3598 [Mycobacterium sp.]|jgi:hypothetical protein|nr:hypothetical protein [Mycobacterium sp.]
MTPLDDERVQAMMQPPSTSEALRRETLYILLTCFGLMAILFAVVYLWPR